MRQLCPWASCARLTRTGCRPTCAPVETSRWCPPSLWERALGRGVCCCWRAVAYHRLNRTLAPETRLMPMDSQEIARLIKARFPDAEVTIRDLAGDGDHYAAHVISKEFRGKTRVQQHKMVYEALEGRMGGVLHALALTTAAPPD